MTTRLGRRPLRPLPAHLFVTLSLIPADGVWIAEHALTEAAGTHRGMQISQGRIVGIRHLRRHGFVKVDVNDTDLLWTRTPKGTDALAARIRKQARS
jgi:hypothetical protein